MHNITTIITKNLTSHLYNSHLNQISITKSIIFSFNIHNKPKWELSASNNIFKDYYSRRLNLHHKQLSSFLYKLSQTKFIHSDHRWTSLLSNIQTNLLKYTNKQLLSILKSLIKSQYSQGSVLMDKIVDKLFDELSELNFEQLGLLLWCLSRTGNKDIEKIYKIYNSMIRIFQEYKDNENNTIHMIIQFNYDRNKNRNTDDKDKNRSDDKNKNDHEIQKTLEGQDDLENKVMIISVGNICRILTSMANLHLTQKKLLKYLIRNVIRQHIQSFSCETLCNILLAYQKLGLRNKRDTLIVYQTIRQKYIQLQQANVISLFNLAICVSNLSLRDCSQHQEEQSKESLQYKEKLQRSVSDMKLFFLWIFQTIFLKDNLSKQMAAKLIFYSSKADIYHEYLWKKATSQVCNSIQNAKIIDLVMTLKALVLLNRDKRIVFEQEQKIISVRLWALYSSIEGKSLEILSFLYQKKRIHPPPKMTKVILDYRLRQQSKLLSKQTDSNSQPQHKNKKNSHHIKEQGLR